MFQWGKGVNEESQSFKMNSPRMRALCGVTVNCTMCS
jgi:hypothetical protein